MVEDSAALANEYFRAWKAKDFAALRAILADHVTFDARDLAAGLGR